jgi:selenocysteine lyase/cysteine desulfurase
MDASSAQLDYGPRGISEAVRASVHYYNDDNDLDRLVEGVKEMT